MWEIDAATMQAARQRANATGYLVGRIEPRSDSHSVNRPAPQPEPTNRDSEPEQLKEVALLTPAGESSKAETHLSTHGGPSGIGGWLILPAIGMVLGPIYALVGFGQFPSIVWEKWDQVPAPFQVLISVELCVQVARFLASIAAAALFFGRRRITPAFLIWAMALNIGWTITDAIWASSLLETPTAVEGTIAPVISGCIWIPYFCLSRRVRNTFVQ